MKPDLAHPDRKTIQSFFNSIPSRYDFLNSFFSMGLDVYWRKKVVQFSVTPSERSILDLGVGTGRSLKQFLETHAFERAVGCDFSINMLAKAKEKLGDRAGLSACDFHELPFSSDTFDLLTGSFILRSVQNMEDFLEEVNRVLKPGGKAVFLELTRPKNPFIWNCLYRPYVKFYIPAAGRLFSRHDQAYQFLSQSIQSFIDPADLKRQFESVGFETVTVKPLSFGAATIIEGRKRK